MAADLTPTLVLPLLPLRNAVLLPFTFMPITVGKSNTMAAIEPALAHEEKSFLVVAQRNPSVEQPKIEDLYGIGTRTIVKKIAHPKRSWSCWCRASHVSL